MQIYFPGCAIVALCPVVMQVPMCKVRCLLAFHYLGYNFRGGGEEGEQKRRKRLNHISELEAYSIITVIATLEL